MPPARTPRSGPARLSLSLTLGCDPSGERSPPRVRNTDGYMSLVHHVLAGVRVSIRRRQVGFDVGDVVAAVGEVGNS